MDKALLHTIEAQLGSRVRSCHPISGGDISSAFWLETADTRLFCKFNSGKHAIAMFRAEKLGLEAIAACGFLNTPEVIFCGQAETGAVLLMEYIEAKNPSPEDMVLFGEQLALMHQAPQQQFGWVQPNFIGRLEQSNNHHPDWPTFYTRERLLPQMKWAASGNLLPPGNVPTERQMIEVITSFCHEVQPSLLHGDLWGGNYLIAHDGRPYLIDPAVYCGHSEADLAMSKLFGGFSPEFYKGYFRVLGQPEGFDQRMEIYQLYYLLVHLNLFGGSYFGPVKNILNTYFRV